jgi:serine/threonine-protein kinase
MIERFGDYQLVRYLTAGGMADLYLATTPRHPGYLVLKRIQRRYIEMTRVVRMFIDEGRIAQALDHPNIVKVLDVGQEGGNYFIAMEYINGRDLLAVCRRGLDVGMFLPLHLAVAIVSQALRGLVYAHEKRDAEGKPLAVVHCDVSPGNLVMSWGGTLKLVDFGIARANIQLRDEDHSVAGKYNYMAPEQIRGEPVDSRADLFAIGIILYELTVGKRLFRGRPEQVMRLVTEEPIPRPSQALPGYPPRLEAIVLRALERDRTRRYPSARALRDELRAWLADEGQAHGKRELSQYLHTIFNAERRHVSDEFGSDGDEDEDDELVLDAALPSLPGDESRPVEPDPEDPEEEPVGLHSDSTAPIPRVDLDEPSPPRGDRPATGPREDTLASRLPPATPARPAARPIWHWLAAAAGVVLLGVGLYFLRSR